jgi:hypothetical protein
VELRWTDHTKIHSERVFVPLMRVILQPTILLSVVPHVLVIVFSF